MFFTTEERGFFERAIGEGFLQKARGSYWWMVRLAIARSLQEKDNPDDSRYRAPGGSGRSELHLEQITGRGSSVLDDLDSSFIMLLSVRHGLDLFQDQEMYVDVIQRHARRGIELLQLDWRPGTTFPDALLDTVYAAVDGVGTGAAAAGLFDFAALQRGLQQISVAATPVGEPVVGPRLTRFALTLGGVEDYDRLRRGLDDLAFAVGLGSGGIGLARGAGERRVVLDVPRPVAGWIDVSWSGVRDALDSAKGILPVCPGVDVIGRPLVFDLAEAPHLFVAGATGSGKSVCVNAILLSLLCSQRTPELVMIDPKGVDFSDYDGCHALRGGRVITDMAAAVDTLRSIVVEMEERQVELRKSGARNLAEAPSSRMNRVVVVVDELADFMMGRSGAEEPLIRIAQKARAVGIHLLLATQRPEAATFPGLLRANIPSRIALTVQKATDSRIILDEGGAENLMMRGDMLVKLAGREAVRAHGARVERADIAAAVKAVNER